LSREFAHIRDELHAQISLHAMEPLEDSLEALLVCTTPEQLKKVVASVLVVHEHQGRFESVVQLMQSLN
jgi:hypothetical protein